MTQVLRSFPKARILGALVVAGTAFLVAALARGRRRRGMQVRRALTTSIFDGLVVLAFAGPLAVTLPPSGGLTGRHLDLVPLRSAWEQLTSSVDAEAAAVQLVGNVLIFVPFGFLAPIRWSRLDDLWRVLTATIAFGAIIEGLQVALGGRIASVSDLLLYAVGGLVGFGMLRGWRRLRSRFEHQTPPPEDAAAASGTPPPQPRPGSPASKPGR